MQGILSDKLYNMLVKDGRARWYVRENDTTTKAGTIIEVGCRGQWIKARVTRKYTKEPMPTREHYIFVNPIMLKRIDN